MNTNTLLDLLHQEVIPVIGCSALASLCHVAHTDQQLIQLCQKHYTQPFTIQQREQRIKELKFFNNAYLVKLLINYLTV